MNDPLADMKIEPVDADARPATEEEVEALHGQVPEWEIVSVDGIRRLRRTYPFPDFAGALEFANAVGALAEREWHHPEITIFHVENGGSSGWGRVTVTWATMIIEQLHGNDFAMAAKTDRVYGVAD